MRGNFCTMPAEGSAVFIVKGETAKNIILDDSKQC